MKKYKVTSKDLKELGYKPGPIFGLILSEFSKSFKYYNKEEQLAVLKLVKKDPKSKQWNTDPLLEKIARFLAPPVIEDMTKSHKLNDKSVPLEIYGREGIEEGALNQIYIAGKLPISVKAALMPDAHQGYGLPIGGVLATKEAVIPYGVGVDIGCRMALTLYDSKYKLKGHDEQIKNALNYNTFFGTGVENDMDVDSHIMDDERWNSIKVIKDLKDTAWKQLGTSGGGNHFIDVGHVEMGDEKFIGILTHSGSRGLGAQLARHYTGLAKKACGLPKDAAHLAWLDMKSDEGQEYWLAMNLAGDYAKACHDEIHRRVAKYLGWKPLRKIENHHNFAWKETINGEDLIVHRKGATPAQKGVLGIVPGSMASDAFIIEGKGNENSINSAAHGAGRVLSRNKAKEKISKSMMRSYLKERGVELIGADVDESPHAYKDIHKVMEFQKDLVNIIGKFTPKIVKMA